MSGRETPARARIKAKDEAEFERWRKLAEKHRRGRSNSERSETRPTGSPPK